MDGIQAGVMSDSAVDALFSDTPVADVADAAPVEEPAAADVPAEGDIDPPEDPGDAGVVEDDAATEPDEADVPTEEPVAAAEQTDEGEIPEGVTVRERNGKKEWVYPADRGRNIYEAYKLAKEAETVIGEPLSLEALQDRQTAHDWVTNQKIDFISPSADDQRNVFANIFREAAAAINNGEIGHDPLETAADAFMATLRHMAPEHYEAATTKIFTDQLQSFYDKAAETGNEKLLRSVQNLDHFLTGKYKQDDEVKRSNPKTDPLADRERMLTEREQRIERHRQQQAVAAWRDWNTQTSTLAKDSVKSLIEGHITEPIRKAFEAMPNGSQHIQNIHTLLDAEVRDAIAKDQNWKAQKANLLRQAEWAPTEQARETIRQALLSRYKQSVAKVLQAKAPGIISAQTHGLKTASAARNQRQAAAAQQKGAVGGGTPPARNIPGSAASDGTWDDYCETALRL